VFDETGCIDDPCVFAAYTRSSVGCLYYAVDTNPIHSFVSGDYAIAVTNVDNATTANVIVEQKNGLTWSSIATFTVTPLDMHIEILPHRYTDGSTIYEGGAYRISSSVPVVAYQFNPIDGTSSFLSDASLLLPVTAMDTQYIVPAWPYGPADGSQSSGWPAHVQIAASAATDVRVTSPVVTEAGIDVPSMTPGVEETFALEEGDYLQLTVQNFLDSFAGMLIDSDEPIAVFSSNDCANVPTGPPNACCCDHLEEQVFGLQAWGEVYVAARVPQRVTEGAVWHILAEEDATTVTFDFDGTVTGLPTEVTLNAAEWVEYEVNGPSATPGDFVATADKPIHLTQYMVGGLGGDGDPAMVQALPVEQFIDQYVVVVPATWVNDYLVLVRESGQTVYVDGAPVTSGWTQVGTSSYEVVRTAVADGAHVLYGTVPFGVVVVGWDSYDSYAYPGGLLQEIINPIP
jgi:hypothetical protein